MKRPASIVSVALLGALWAGSAAAATVTKLASNVYQNLYGIAADQHGVYVTGSTAILRDFDNSPTAGVIGIIPLAGGAVTTLYSVNNYVPYATHVAPMQIATDGAGNLVWADPDAGPDTGASFETGTWTGAAANQIFGICCGPSVLPGDGFGVAFANNTIYFSDATGGRAGKNPSGGGATQIGPTRYSPDFSTENWAQISVAGNRLYLADSGQNRGAQNGMSVVWQLPTSLIKPGIRFLVLPNGTSFHTLTLAIKEPQGIVAVGTTLYVTTARAIWTVDTTSGAVKVLVQQPGFVDLQGITWYNGALYVADSQNHYGAPVNGVATAAYDHKGVVWMVVP